MAKDITALKDSIKEVLIEQELLAISVKSEVLFHSCVEAKDKETTDKMIQSIAAGGNGVLNQQDNNENIVKRRGRPRKYARQPVFATISSTLYEVPGNMIVRYETNNAEIHDWKKKKEDLIRKQKYPFLVDARRGKINWKAVSAKVNSKTRKSRSEMDCYLAFKHEADPMINCRRWSLAETNKLHHIVDEVGIHEMSKIISQLGGRTEFQCYQKWKNSVGKSQLMTWNAEKDEELRELVRSSEGNWKQIAFKFNDELATKNKLMDRFKKNSNPILKPGQFSRLEDALLLLTIEKLKAHIDHEGHFGELIAYLPWRFETVWRDRAGNLFANFIIPWTIEEDKQLLELAVTMNRDWRKISDTFKSFKNRKGCLTRHKILEKRIKKFGSVEKYHESYSMTRYNVFQYRHLGDILDILTSAVNLKRLKGVTLSLEEAPTDAQLAQLLLSYDRGIMNSTINSLRKYIEERDAHWKEFIVKVNDRQRTFDRRTFHPDSAQSMASAIHIRGLQLKDIPNEELAALSVYEQDIYKYHARFTRTKPLKKSAKRPYIPGGRTLSEMAQIKNVVVPGIYYQDDDEGAEVHARPKARPRGRKPKIVGEGEPSGMTTRGTARKSSGKGGRRGRKRKIVKIEEIEIESSDSEPECVDLCSDED